MCTQAGVSEQVISTPATQAPHAPNNLARTNNTPADVTETADAGRDGMPVIQDTNHAHAAVLDTGHLHGDNDQRSGQKQFQREDEPSTPPTQPRPTTVQLPEQVGARDGRKAASPLRDRSRTGRGSTSSTGSSITIDDLLRIQAETMRASQASRTS